MTAVQTLSLVLLGACLVLAVWRRINIGVLALAAAFVLVRVAGADVDTMYKKFPGSIFCLLVGVSLLFAHLERSGALTAAVSTIFRAVGGRAMLLPWACFLVAATLSSMGAFSTAPIALLVPAVAALSWQHKPSFLINELAIVIGANTAGLSPLNPTGAAVRKAMTETGVTYNGWGLWVIGIVTGAVAVAVLQQVDRWQRRRSGLHLVPLPPAVVADPADGPTLHPAYALCSGLALLGFVLSTAFFGFDIGLTSLFLVVVLQLAFRPSEKALLARVPWNAILLLCGLLTYLALVQQVGTMKAIQKDLTAVSTPALLVLVLAYLAALLCNIESSTLGVLTLVAPLVGASLGHSPALLLVLGAVAAPAALTVMNPVHVAGTLIVANTQEDQQTSAFSRLFGISVALSAVAPAVLSAIAITRL